MNRNRTQRIVNVKTLLELIAGPDEQQAADQTDDQRDGCAKVRAARTRGNQSGEQSERGP